MKRESKNSPRRALSLERQVKCLKLRLTGLSFRKIGEAVGISEKQACILTAKALQELREQKLALADDIRQLEICRQEELLQTVWLEARKGSLKHIDRAQTIIQRITELHCVDVKPAPPVAIPPDLKPGEASAIVEHASQEELAAIEAGDVATIAMVIERVRSR